jgi:hypothetical protein
VSDTDSDSGIVKDFLVESYENLDRLDRNWRAPMIGMRSLACFVPSALSKASAAFWVSPNWRGLRTSERAPYWELRGSFRSAMAEEPFGVSGGSLSGQNFWWCTPSPRLLS